MQSENKNCSSNFDSTIRQNQLENRGYGVIYRNEILLLFYSIRSSFDQFDFESFKKTKLRKKESVRLALLIFMLSLIEDKYEKTVIAVLILYYSFEEIYLKAK